MHLTRIFCVIDPTTLNQRALTRATGIAVAANVPVHAYLCIDPLTFNQPGLDPAALREVEMDRHSAWLERLVAPVRERGVAVTTEVECRDDWRSALAPAAKRADADLVIKASARRTVIQRRLLKTADWTLLRSAPCPVLFVKAEADKKLDRVLAAVNLQAGDEAHVALTDEVIAQARRIADTFGAELHAANAYSGSLNFVHPPDVAKRVGIERRRAHVGDMSPDALLREVVKKHDIPLVIIGSIARSGVSGAVVGNTAERILDSLECDVAVIMRTNPGT